LVQPSVSDSPEPARGISLAPGPERAERAYRAKPERAADHEYRAELERAAEWIADADALLYCAGAGIGVDSGLPDFRGSEGFWRAYPPYRRLGLSFVELADPVHFTEDPELAWGFYGHRLALYRSTTPHAGFGVLLRWARGGRPARVFTSNVDGQFQRAGFTEDAVEECHGSIHHLQCLAGCTSAIWSAHGTEVRVDPASMRALRPLPACPHCGGLARPNILMFGDLGWLSARTDAQMRRHLRWLRELRANGARLVVLEVGAGTAVSTVRRHAELAAASSRGLIRVNTREPSVRHGRGISLPLPAARALRALEALPPRSGQR
jgi:NAD-dependent SIR2 family protein deacetylase